MDLSRRSATIALFLLTALAFGTIVSVGPAGWSGSVGGWPGFGHGAMMGGHGGVGRSGPVPESFDGAIERDVVADDFFFDPGQLTVSAGVETNITLVNSGRVFHDITIASVGFQLGVSPGEIATGGLIGLDPGTYPFECSVPGHASAGMVGELVVEA